MRVLKAALVLSFVCVRLLAYSGEKQFVRAARGENPPFSLAIRAGEFGYVSGIMYPDVKGDITAQMKQVFGNLGSVLRRAESVVSTRYEREVTRQVTLVPIVRKD